MSNTKSSPKGAIRKSIARTYRARKHSNNNLWLLYSPKTDRDWILDSDRRLIHWLYFLESDPRIVSFELAPEGYAISEGLLDAIAIRRDGRTEWHKIVSAAPSKSPASEESTLDEVQGRSIRRIPEPAFTMEMARVALRWLRPISYAAALRGQQLTACNNAVAGYCELSKKGTLRDIVEGNGAFEQNAVVGVAVRLSISGSIAFDLTSAPFGPDTRWWTEHE